MDQARKAVISQWHADGEPPCPVCDTAVTGAEVRVSQIWKAVVHPFCQHIRVLRPLSAALAKGACTLYPHCPAPLQRPSGPSCVCPAATPVNLIVLARRLGQPTVDIPVTPHSAAERAAKAAGLGVHYHNAPLREDPRCDAFRKHGTLAPGIDPSIWNQPSSWYAPPATLKVDVDRTIREGRIIAWTPATTSSTDPDARATNGN